MGAAEEVTGSNFLVETNGLKFIVDCGMTQGSKNAMERNYREFNYNPAELDFLLITHAHIDHTGLVPKLIKEGFKGDIYCTNATSDLLEIMLHDSAHIQQIETERYNKKRLRKGLSEVEAIYDTADVEKTLSMIKSVSYMENIKISDKFSFVYHDAGHILGSAFIKVKSITDKGEMTVVFSGDLGNSPVPILKDPQELGYCDYLIMESTYGNRIREADNTRMQQLADIINKGQKTGGKIIIPSFAVGRTQEILYDISELLKDKKIEPINIYVDSPMATNTTQVFKKHADCYDIEAKERLRNNDNPFDFPHLKFTQSVEDSMRLNTTDEQCIIISASGMCTAGRIKHHLKHNIYKPDTTILFIGYQGRGTLGRMIKNGVKMVRIHGQQYSVKADIQSIEGFSAHADQRGLINWSTSTSKPKNIILVHGEPDAQAELAHRLGEKGIEALIPKRGETIELFPSKENKSPASIYVPQLQPEIITETQSDDELLKEELIALSALQTQMAVLTNKVDSMVKRISGRMNKK